MSNAIQRPNQPCFFGYLSGSGNKTSATGNGVIDTAAINVGSHFNTSNGRFTCPVAGYYLVMWTAMNHQNNTGTGQGALRVNGTTYKYFHTPNSHPEGQSDQLIYYASADDYFDLSMTNFHYNGGSANKYPSFSVYLLG